MSQIRNMLTTQLPIKLTTAYFVIGGVVYIHSTFNPTSSKFLEWVQHSDLVVLDNGQVIKNRGIVDVSTLAKEIQKVVLNGLDAYDASNPTLYFAKLSEKQFNAYDVEKFQTLRSVAASVLSLYK